MPVKFSLRIAASVDPAQPFVYNEDLGNTGFIGVKHQLQFQNPHADLSVRDKVHRLPD